MSGYIRLNIAIIPPEKVFRAAINLSCKLSKFGDTSFVLDGENYHPHITCYSPEFPATSMEKIVEELDLLTRTLKPFKGEVEGVVVTTEDEPHGIEIKITKTEQIDELHKKIIEKLNPLREEHLRAKYQNPAYFLRFPNNKQKLYKKITYQVGYPRVLDLYNPHISIIRYENPKVVQKAIERIRWNIKSMAINRIGIFTMGNHGMCKELLHEFKFEA